MGKIRDFFDRWLSRLSGVYSFWPLLFPTGTGALIAYFSTGVSWIAKLGPFGWATSGLLAFVVTTAGMLMLSRRRFLIVETKIRERISGDSSPFDPMAKVYEDKRLYLRDLAPMGRKRIEKKKFLNCEIIGPGTAIIGLATDPDKSPVVMKNCNTFDVDCIEIDTKKVSNLAIGFWDCDFEGCNFYHMTLLFLHRSNDTLHWITPEFRSAPLLEDRRDG